MAKAPRLPPRIAPNKTYVVGLCNLVFAEARDPKDVPRIQKNADWLIDNALGWKGTGKIEGWSYPQNKMADNSNTQYALLGLYAAKQAGAKIPDNVWKAIQDYYTRYQATDGTSGYWTYYNERGPGSISMTVAGVCGLLIAAMGLDQSEQKLNPDTGVAEFFGLYSENTPVAKGMNWVADHFTFSSPKSTFYNIYGMERLGRISGQLFIGTPPKHLDAIPVVVTDRSHQSVAIAVGVWQQRDAWKLFIDRRWSPNYKEPEREIFVRRKQLDAALLSQSGARAAVGNDAPALLATATTAEAKRRSQDTNQAALLRSRIESVFAAAKRLCDERKRKVEFSPMAEKLKGTGGYKAPTIRQILNGTYPPAKRRGIGAVVCMPPAKASQGRRGS